MSSPKTNRQEDPNTLPWYSDGLRFECTGCGDCCTGEPGFVWVNKSEIAKIAKLLKLEVDKFEEKYVRKIGIRKSLIELANGDCIFFNNKSRQCQVYEARPRQCKSWPFWKSNLRTEEAWQETCEFCPGSGKGKLYNLEEIEERASQRLL